jgi:hypothetical protein
MQALLEFFMQLIAQLLQLFGIDMPDQSNPDTTTPLPTISEAPLTVPSDGLEPSVAQPTEAPCDPAPITNPSTNPAPIITQAPIVPVDPATVATPEKYGAKCDGTTDDTAALQIALNATTTGKTLQIGAGKSCRHTNVLHVKNAGARIIGPGSLVATNPQQSSFMVEANNVTLDGNLVLKMTANTPRLEAEEHHKLTIRNASGVTVKNITIDGSAAAGIFISATTNYLIQDVTVQNTLADAIHNTNKSSDGNIVRPIIKNPGDDGIAVVSYHKDNGYTHDITIDSPKVYGQTHGRGISVVGGQNITYKNVYVERSSAAAIYIAAEGNEYDTYGASNIKVLGATLVDSNQDPTVNHGAVHISAYNPGNPLTDITIQDVTIQNTRASSGTNVAAIAYNGGANERIQLLRFTITGGSAKALDTAGTPANQYNSTGWTQNGAAIPDHKGF